MVLKPQKQTEYRLARSLRRNGLSYNQISRELMVAKSSISLWCRDIILSPKQTAVLVLKSRTLGQKMGALANRQKRLIQLKAIKENAEREIVDINAESFLIAGTMIYWAEGSKTQNTAVTNSNPKIISFMVRWFEEILGIKPNRLNAHLHIHQGDDDLKIKRFWSKLTGIPLKNFGKSFLKPKGTGHRTNILPYGIIRIRVAGPGTGDIRHKILSWSDRIHDLVLQKQMRP